MGDMRAPHQAPEGGIGRAEGRRKGSKEARKQGREGKEGDEILSCFERRRKRMMERKRRIRRLEAKAIEILKSVERERRRLGVSACSS
jgi:hypothetical protein